MKTSFHELMDQTDASLLGDSLDRLQGEKTSRDTVSRLQKKVTGASEKRAGKMKNWLPAAVAACVVLTLGIAWGTGAFTRNAPPAAGPGEDTPLRLVGVPETEDRFAENTPAAEEGVFSEAAADRMEYRGIRFYESEGSVYMICTEHQPVYRYDVGGFVNTGRSPAEQQFFSTGTYGGYAYLGGVFHCVGGNESGLFRVDLKTGRIEKYIDCRETVTSVAVEGSKIYYSTCTRGDPAAVTYSLKCADVEKRQITRIISDASFFISDLRIEGDRLYFRSNKGVRYIGPDMTLGTVGNAYADSYAFWNGNVYIYTAESGGDEDGGNRICTVSGYDRDGNPLGSVSALQRFDDEGETNAGSREYVGDSLDGVTVFRGRVVYIDDRGVWLQDVLTGEAEQILEIPFRDRSLYGISKTVYDGKLFVCLYDSVIVYDGERPVTLPLDKAE